METDLLRQLLPVYAAYLIAVASPGPSTLAIMGAAMRQGRLAALALAAGVLCGSQIWAWIAASGLSVLLTGGSGALGAIRIAGGLYLLYLAIRAARSALAGAPPETVAAPVPAQARYGAMWRRGLLLHLTNPKAVLGWMAILSLGLGGDSQGPAPGLLLAGCAVIGATVFCGYALLFSTAPMIAGYRRARSWIEGAMAGIFGFAGLGLLLSRG